MHGADFQQAIADALQRSRNVRRARQRRRRHGIALAALLAVSLAGGGFWSIDALAGSGMVEAATVKVESLADLIAHRSPGARTEAQLTKHARVLAKVRAAPQPHIAPPAFSSDAPVDHFAQVLEAPPLTPAAVDLEQPVPLAEIIGPPPFPSAVLFPGPASGPDMSPPGGSSPAGSFPGTQPAPPIVSPPAVPEPDTWAMMLLGFGLIGWRVRRRPQRGAQALQA